MSKFALLLSLCCVSFVGCRGASNAEGDAEKAQKATIQGLNEMAEIYEKGGTVSEVEAQSAAVSKKIKAAREKLTELGK
ncbi:MAG: hypothetical protein AAF492_04665, partial [Verrucomicrobiota bacterium]